MRDHYERSEVRLEEQRADFSLYLLPNLIIMDFLNALFLILGPCGLIFVVVAWLMLKYPPKEINQLYGYRTPASMKSQERWDFAQVYSSRLMFRMGWIFMAIAIPALFLQIDEGISAFLGLGLLIGGTIWLLVSTERAIKARFKNE